MNRLNIEHSTNSSAIIDRRQENIDSEILWDRLTDAQQLAVCSLFPTGYILACARKVNQRLLAIMTCQKEVMTIDYLGNIHIAMNIDLRN